MTSPPDELPATLSAGRLLRDVAPHQLAETLVGLAEQQAGCATALYVIDLDGTELRRVAGSAALPHRVPIARVVGPELPVQALDAVRERLRSYDAGELTAAPLWLRDRAVALLVTQAPPAAPLDDFVREAAAAIELAEGYCDEFASGRRREPTGPSSELQQSLLPPRIATAPDAEIACGILPAYDVGGDWLDHAASAAGARIGLGDAVGKGERAAALSALAVATQRSARRAGASIAETAWAVHEVLARFSEQDFMTLVLADWDARDRQLAWLSCGHYSPLLLRASGALDELDGARTLPVGIADLPPQITVNYAHLEPGDRVVLFSDGIVERRAAAGGHLGLAGLRAALSAAPDLSASAAVSVAQSAVVDATTEALRDDASILVLAVRMDIQAPAT